MPSPKIPSQKPTMQPKAPPLKAPSDKVPPPTPKKPSEVKIASLKNTSDEPSTSSAPADTSAAAIGAGEPRDTSSNGGDVQNLLKRFEASAAPLPPLQKKPIALSHKLAMPVPATQLLKPKRIPKQDPDSPPAIPVRSISLLPTRHLQKSSDSAPQPIPKNGLDKFNVAQLRAQLGTQISDSFLPSDHRVSCADLKEKSHPNKTKPLPISPLPKETGLAESEINQPRGQAAPASGGTQGGAEASGAQWKRAEDGSHDITVTRSGRYNYVICSSDLLGEKTLLLTWDSFAEKFTTNLLGFTIKELQAPKELNPTPPLSQRLLYVCTEKHYSFMFCMHTCRLLYIDF